MSLYSILQDSSFVILKCKRKIKIYYYNLLFSIYAYKLWLDNIADLIVNNNIQVILEYWLLTESNFYEKLTKLATMFDLIF